MVREGTPPLVLGIRAGPRVTGGLHGDGQPARRRLHVPLRASPSAVMGVEAARVTGGVAVGELGHAVPPPVLGRPLRDVVGERAGVPADDAARAAVRVAPPPSPLDGVPIPAVASWLSVAGLAGGLVPQRGAVALAHGTGVARAEEAA